LNFLLSQIKDLPKQEGYKKSETIPVMIRKMEAIIKSEPEIADVASYQKLRDELRKILTSLPKEVLIEIQKNPSAKEPFIQIVLGSQMEMSLFEQDFLTDLYIKENNLNGFVQSLEYRYHLFNQGQERSMESILTRLINQEKVEMAVEATKRIYQENKTRMGESEKDLLCLVVSYLMMKEKKEFAKALLSLLPEPIRSMEIRIEQLQGWLERPRDIETIERWQHSISGMEKALKMLRQEP
jgi:hypothetical protein